jgi:HEAT repeat protein
MKTLIRRLFPIAWMLAGALAQAQTPASTPAPAHAAAPLPPISPTPPAPVTAPLAPAPAAAPLPPIPPTPPEPLMAPLEAWGQLSLEQEQKIAEAAEKAQEAATLIQEKTATINQEQIRAAMEKAKEQLGNIKFDFDLNVPLAAQMRNMNIRVHRGDSDDGLYERGRRELDQRSWDQAVATFGEVVPRGGARADGALYWKAYALNKLGRRDEALAAIAELRKSYAGSHWLDDAKALEVEVRQAAGGTVAPESQNDDEIKLLALNGLMQSDPDRAFPLLEKLLKSANSPKMKDQAVFVLAESGSPKAQQLLAEIARGGGNPDLQLTAIRYMSAANRRQGSNNQALFEIYNSSSDTAVKREILNALGGVRDKDRLLEIARNEKSRELRLYAIRMLGSTGAEAEIWQLYQTETSPELKRQILAGMTGASDRLIQVARTEKDPALRRTAIMFLGSVKAPNTTGALVGMYGSEQDKDVKRTIIDALATQRNAKALVEIGRQEKDLGLKKDIVRRLTDMKTPEAEAFLEEILK